MHALPLRQAYAKYAPYSSLQSLIVELYGCSYNSHSGHNTRAYHDGSRCLVLSHVAPY